jgi:hypothetical protein
MNTVLQNLLKLQGLEFGKGIGKDAGPVAAELRTKIPPPILGHYDRLLARGKKGVAIVSNQVCTGCHMSVPIGVITMLMRGEDIQLCDTCGRYLYLPPPVAAPAAEPPADKKSEKSVKPAKVKAAKAAKSAKPAKKTPRRKIVPA